MITEVEFNGKRYYPDQETNLICDMVRAGSLIELIISPYYEKKGDKTTIKFACKATRPQHHLPVMGFGNSMWEAVATTAKVINEAFKE
jgi:hypothetical protein